MTVTTWRVALQRKVVHDDVDPRDQTTRLPFEAGLEERVSTIQQHVKYKLLQPFLGFDQLKRKIRELPIGAAVELPLKPNEIGLVGMGPVGRTLDRGVRR
jgi:hypothetical protein